MYEDQDGDVDSEQPKIDALIERFRAKAHNTYLVYISLLKRDGCIGSEIKLELGKFNEAELNAHREASEMLGRYRAYIEIVNILEEEINK